MTEPTKAGVTEYAAGERVEVLDRDKGRWCAGTVMSWWNRQDSLPERPPDARMLIVKSDNEFEGDLPLTWGVPIEAVDDLVRRVQ